MQCECPCHCGGVRLFHRPPETTEPIAALTCCDLCALLHQGVWRVYRRPWAHDVPPSDQGEGPEC